LKVLELCGLQPRKLADWKKWSSLVVNILNPPGCVKVAMVGKYVDIGEFTLRDSYISVNEALTHAGANLGVGVDIQWIDAKQIEGGDVSRLKDFQGIIIPGGFGSSGVEGKIQAIRYARENNIPFLGLCYGLQLAVVEYARNVCGIEDAHTTEVNPQTTNPVIDILESQKEVMNRKEFGASMRLGSYGAFVDEDSKVYSLYSSVGRLEKDAVEIKSLGKDRLGVGNVNVVERHRHRYEVNPGFIGSLQAKGLKFPGYHLREDGTKLMEFIELPGHPFFMATQAHPEFKSRLEDPSPLFYGFVRACSQR
jgi:CTP synthase